MLYTKSMKNNNTFEEIMNEYKALDQMFSESLT
jgi:hypothetical protein